MTNDRVAVPVASIVPEDNRVSSILLSLTTVPALNLPNEGVTVIVVVLVVVVVVVLAPGTSDGLGVVVVVVLAPSTSDGLGVRVLPPPPQPNSVSTPKPKRHSANRFVEFFID